MTFLIGEDGEGEGNAALTPVATMPCRASVKAWRAESKIPRDVRPVAGGGPLDVPLPPVGPTPLSGSLVCVGGGGVE